MAQFGRRGRIISAVVIAAVLAAASAVILVTLLAPPSDRLFKVGFGTVTLSASASGRLQCARYAAPDFSSEGTVTEIHVKVGDTVEEGQKLAELDSREAESKLAVAQAEYEAAKAALEVARQRLAEAEERDEDVLSATAELQQQEALLAQKNTAVSAARQELASTELIAPISGTVTAVHYNIGDRVQLQQPRAQGVTDCSVHDQASGFLEIADLSSMHVVGMFSEADIAKIELDQSAEITFDALPDMEPVPARVTGIAPTVTVSGGSRYYEVELQPEHLPEKLKPGQSVDIEVLVAKVDDVLRVPNEALHGSGANSSLTVLQDGERRQVRVDTGVRGDAYTEIIAGIAPGSIVVLPERKDTPPTQRASHQCTRTGLGFGAEVCE